MALSTAIHLSGKVPAPVPHVPAYWAVDALYAAGVVEAPSGFIDYVRYPCVADGARAKRVLDFEAKFTSRQSLDSYIAYRHPMTINEDAADTTPSAEDVAEAAEVMR